MGWSEDVEVNNARQAGRRPNAVQRCARAPQSAAGVGAASSDAARSAQRMQRSAAGCSCAALGCGTRGLLELPALYDTALTPRARGREATKLRETGAGRMRRVRHPTHTTYP